jgi:RNA polymerase sigma-70 factor (sigma-E family)
VDVVNHMGMAGTAHGSRSAARTESVSTLFVVHHRRLVGLAALLVTDQETAEDVVQEAFAGLYRRWRQLRDPDAAVAYLNRAVVNGSRDALRHGRRATALVPRLVPRSVETASAEHDAIQHDDADRLWQAITQLPPRQLQVLVLRYYLNHSEAEIAATLGVSRGSVKKHASRGLASLARCLEAES